MVPHIDRRDFLRGAGTAGLAGLAGCTGTITGSGRTIRIGVLMGVTGGLEQLGPPIRKGAELAINQAQEADTSVSVEMQFEDTNTSASQGISGAEALVNAGYPMICGALASPVTIQVAKQVAIPNGVTMCSPASTSPEITTLDDNDLVYRTPPTDALQGRALASIARNRLDASSAATFYLNQAYGQGVDQGFVKAFKDQGGTVTNRVSFEPGQSSYTSQLRTALENDPDTMLIVGYPESGVQIFRDFYSEFDRGDMPLLVTDGLQDETLPGKVGQDMSNVSGTAPLPSGPGNDFFTRQYKEAYGSEPSVSFIGYAYDAAAVLMLANAAAGENTGSVIKKQMTAVANPSTDTNKIRVPPSSLADGLDAAASGDPINYIGASSSIAFDSAGDMKVAKYQYFRFTSDGLETVDTINFGGN